jgi:deazaflavin-dependent oxidoreductase (nitroreductase family)
MRVVICGAGIAGLTLANRTSVLGGEVTLLERAPGPRSQGYMIDFFGPGYDAAETMGLLPAIGDVAYPIDEVSLVDGHGRRRAGVPYMQFARSVDGRLCSVMRPDLEAVLQHHLPENVDLWFGTTVVGVADDGDAVLVTLDDGTELEADLLVGADGVHSTVRRLVFGAESEFLRYLGFHTAAFIFDAPRIRAEVGNRFVLTDTVGKQMGFYVLRDGRVAAFAVHRTPDSTLPDDARAAVQHAYRGLGWVVPEALEKCPPSEEIYYDQVAQIELPRWSKGPVTLVGDACYAVSLLAGQGASLGVAGAYVLADQLKRKTSIDRALADYERLWRPVAEEKQKAGRGAARWFLPESAAQLRIRRAALRLAWLPVVNRFIGATLAGKSTVPLVKRSETVRIVKNVRPPQGLRRLLFRMPIYFYRTGLGWLFGTRLLLLNHIGRVSGKPRHVVLEVVAHDGTDDSYVVASGWGPTAAWYRNILHTPTVTIQVGTRTMPVKAVPLSKDEGAEIFGRYASRHRMAAKYLLPRLLGFSVDGSEADFRAVGERLPFVRFVPAP